MRTSRFSAEQIIWIVQEQHGGEGVDEMCRRHGVSLATLYRWKQQYRELPMSEPQRLNVLEAKNARLKRLVAEQVLDNQMLEELLGKRS